MRLRRFLFSLLIASMGISATLSDPAETAFRRVKLLVPIGEKVEETDVVLWLGKEKLTITSTGGDVELRVFPYSRIKEASYSYSKHPRWKEGKKGLVFLPVFFVKGKKHWLTIEAGQDFAVLRLEKENYNAIIPAFEALSHVKVTPLGEEK